MENQTNISPPPKSKTKKIIIILILLLILMLTAVLFWWFFRDRGFSGDLIPAKEIESEQENGIAAIISASGGVLITRGSDNTLYSLTIPPGAVILPTIVTLVPIKKSPIENYGSSTIGSGVYVGPKKDSMAFIRPAYLTIKPNAPKLAAEEFGEAKWGRCNIGSSGFEPEICAGEKELPFGIGIEPGKVIIYSKSNDNKKLNSIYLSPTVPIGEEDTFVTSIWSTGAYTADRLNKKQLESFFQPTFHSGSDYVNKVELLSHWAALDGDLGPYKSEIQRMGRDKKDYPRMVLETAIIADKAGDKESAQKRVDDLKTTIERNLGRVRGSFMNLPYYMGFLKQIDISNSKISASFSRSVSEMVKNMGIEKIIMDAQEKAAGTIDDKNAWTEEIMDALEILSLGEKSQSNLGQTTSELKEKPDGSQTPAGNNPSDNTGPNDPICEKVTSCKKLDEAIGRCNTLSCCHIGGEISSKCCGGSHDKVKKCKDDINDKMPVCKELLIKKDLKTFGQNNCLSYGIQAPWDYIKPDHWKNLSNEDFGKLKFPILPLY